MPLIKDQTFVMMCLWLLPMMRHFLMAPFSVLDAPAKISKA